MSLKWSQVLLSATWVVVLFSLNLSVRLAQAEQIPDSGKKSLPGDAHFADYYQPTRTIPLGADLSVVHSFLEAKVGLRRQLENTALPKGESLAGLISLTKLPAGKYISRKDLLSLLTNDSSHLPAQLAERLPPGRKLKTIITSLERSRYVSLCSSYEPLRVTLIGYSAQEKQIITTNARLIDIESNFASDKPDASIIALAIAKKNAQRWDYLSKQGYSIMQIDCIAADIYRN